MLSKSSYDYLFENSHPDAQFIIENWTRISVSHAKEINPYMVIRLEKLKAVESRVFLTCGKLTSNGCSVYETRPDVCSGYPLYGQTEQNFNDRVFRLNEQSDYFLRCTVWPLTIPIVNLFADDKT